MERPLQITSRDFQLTPAMEDEIRDRAADLELYFPRMTGCHVVVDAPVHHHRKGGPFEVRIDLRLPGAEVSVNRQSADDLAIAIRDAFDAARRRIEDHLRELRGNVKTHELPAIGRVARIFPKEGYGFLETSDHREIYFHRNSVLDESFDDLVPGTSVRFAEEVGDKGPQASTVATVGGRRQPHPGERR
jgi:cold shock CspA family protein/ribosome-associated translation inhibitor RaiA